MTTNPWDTRHGLRRGADRTGLHVTQSTAMEMASRETRLKRLILVGALASFLSIFGLTIAMDQQEARGTENASTTISSFLGNRAPAVEQSQIRTRTS